MDTRKRMLRRMGYLRDQQGIMNRYLRESAHWKNHLEKTRAFIKSSFPEHTSQPDSEASVAVLGSGWLLDVPLEHLLKVFSRVYLVDIFHPAQIRKKTENLDQVILVEEDLSGGAIEQVWNFTSGKGPSGLEDLVDSMQLTYPLKAISPSAMVSLNLLNQLDIILCDHLSRKGKAEEGILDQLRSNIQAFHLQWIMKEPGCLITDTREISIHRDGHEEVKSLIFTSLPEGNRRDQWTWEFDSSGNYRSGIHSRMEVEAVSWI